VDRDRPVIGDVALPSGTRIGLNLVFLTPGATGGMETYTRELLPRLAAAAPDVTFIAFVNRAAASASGPWHDLSGCVEVPVDAVSRVQWVRGEQQLLPPLARRAGVDLLHSLASTAPLWGSFRRVVTIHDLIYRTVPDAHPGLRSMGMRVLVPAAARRAHRIVVDAAATKTEVTGLLHVAESKVDVVALGVNPAPDAAATPAAELRARLNAGERQIVLSVSAKLAHKNLMRLIAAIASLEPSERPLLVLPGYPTPHEDELRAQVTHHGITADVRFLGWVPAADLEGLYATAAAFVFPSLAEGFGLPVLEAMARGVPVACSDRPVLTEVAGDAALRFDPESEAAIARAITRLLSDAELVARLRTAGHERVARFPWSATATGTLAAYRRALADA
jgi:glycosyltransferase involved in cell wall biosynthesis